MLSRVECCGYDLCVLFGFMLLQLISRNSVIAVRAFTQKPLTVWFMEVIVCLCHLFIAA